MSNDLNDKYKVTHSEDEDDPDLREQTHDEDDETSAHLLKAFGSAIDNTFQDEVQQIYEKNGLSPRGFRGQNFTWCNNRDKDARIWKRLDRAMVNDRCLESMPVITVTHLASTSFDHYPLLLECKDNHNNHIKYFKFLQYWVENKTFLDTVKTCWKRPIEGNPMRIFHLKLKRLANTLSNWSRQQYGDIYTTVKDFEEKIKQAEDDLIHDNSEGNRTKLNHVNAQYIRYLKIEQSILKQKTKLQWFKDGDMNSRYFHAIIIGRRRRLFNHKINDDQGNTIQGDQNIATAGKEVLIKEEFINCIPKSITE
ncbi:uncharacterized protein LOC129894869 [Solanum dulcamara]|uniref:uncharacterized protein LOC129894869 n=1 Tax=Solanum dulcamara TaxID=45834 RepID=UPI0024866C5E|nr:uncharacterized protein LOC129894869 [Solanum dulcamara]